EEFEETLEFVKKVKFSKIHVFKYSPREGTIAAKMNGQIDGNIKNERSSTLIELQDNLQIEFMKEQKDKILNVLFEEVIDDYLEGYSTNYLRVAIDPSLAKEGDIKEVKVIKCDEDRLISII
ncbi:MAG TPA: tRNA (N(6)-L-threonylcarbamoyladenosine(37)-C(2))-methylthiotransferase MtaB, partial [Tissierellaceae bacterium]